MVGGGILPCLDLFLCWFSEGGLRRAGRMGRKDGGKDEG